MVIPNSTDLAEATWRKSSYSGNGVDCIEVADQFPGAVPIRDSKRPGGPCIVVPATAWSAFVGQIHSGRIKADL
ncbi:DUF397 domain-containing protein [Streptomyces netropsis]|uniref:DUF397 domain-containing protein n=1 Tax=Streptomyces netropsis TaxID=55404 RepID=UPI0037882251